MYLDIKEMVTKTYTCLAVPFPYSMTDTALCTKHKRWCRHFNSCVAIKHSSGVRSAGLFTSCESSDISVGTFLKSSSLTVSQLNSLTASVVSLRIESLLSELKSFISRLILRASCDTRDLNVDGELTTPAVKNIFFY